MPFWIFTLGRYIFAQGNLTVPYRQISTFVIGLVIPLTIGFFIQKKLPRVSKILIRIMKPFSVILILFIIIFAIVTNLYLFKLFSLKVTLEVPLMKSKKNYTKKMTCIHLFFACRLSSQEWVCLGWAFCLDL